MDTNLEKLLTLKGEFRARFGIPATHVFVPVDELPPGSRPYGLKVVEVVDADALTVGVLMEHEQ